MIAALAQSLVDAVAAVDFDSPAFVLLAAAGAIWAAAFCVCSVAPIVEGPRSSLTETVATALSTAAAALAIVGLLVLLIPAF